MSKTNKKNSDVINRNSSEVAARIYMLKQKGRVEITTKEELEKYSIGSLISYLNNKNKYKTAGFITKFASKYFIYVTPDFNNKYRVRYANIKKMWIGDVYTVASDVISFSESKQKPTNFPVNVNGINVYYGKATFDKIRYINTIKYKRLIEWCKYFNIDITEQ